MTARYYSYGVRKLDSLVRAMITEVPGVRIATDIECIHRMRVASRRARSVLQLFGASFPEESVKRWQKGIRRVTRSLGKARDIDVQIDVLKTFRKTHNRSKHTIGIDHILYHIRKKRRQTQKDVLRNLDRIEKKNLLHEISLYLQENLVQDPQAKVQGSSRLMLRQARVHILKFLDALLEYELYVNQENANDELHQMRIAAKRLRYAMEILSELYSNQLVEYISAVKKIQKYLGEMHDCVVWLEYLPKFLNREKKHIVRYKQAEKRLRSIEFGVHHFEMDRKQFHHKRYRDFFKHWQKIKSEQLFKKLRTYLETPTT